MRSAARGARTIVFLAVVALGASCSGGKDKVAPTTTVAPTTSTTAVVITAPGNPRVSTTLPLDLQGGTAALIGSVTSPAGPVDGATVRVERLVGDAATGIDLQTAGGGRWELRGIKGGRYRVRAWRVPDMAQLQPDVFFLPATEARTLDLKVDPFGAAAVEGTISPSPPMVGQPATLSVLLTGGTVGPDGVARVAPKPGVSVSLSASGALTLVSPAAQVTDGSGRAVWRVQCLLEGPALVVVTEGTASSSLAVPPCGAAASPSTTVP